MNGSSGLGSLLICNSIVQKFYQPLLRLVPIGFHQKFARGKVGAIHETYFMFLGFQVLQGRLRRIADRQIVFSCWNGCRCYI